MRFHFLDIMAGFLCGVIVSGIAFLALSEMETPEERARRETLGRINAISEMMVRLAAEKVTSDVPPIPLP